MLMKGEPSYSNSFVSLKKFYSSRVPRGQLFQEPPRETKEEATAAGGQSCSAYPWDRGADGAGSNCW